MNEFTNEGLEPVFIQLSQLKSNASQPQDECLPSSYLPELAQDLGWSNNTGFGEEFQALSLPWNDVNLDNVSLSANMSTNSFSPRNEDSVNTSCSLQPQGSELASPWVCHDCPHLPPFHHRHQLNKHRKRHERPIKCDIPGCLLSFAYNRDLACHVDAKHKDEREKPAFFCPRPNCDRAEGGRKGGFTREDVLTRHL